MNLTPRIARPVLGLTLLWSLVATDANAQTLVRGTCYDDSFMPVETDGHQVFDLEISLWSTPSPTERALYEEVLQHFSRAVFESSNATHYVRNITVHDGGKQKRFADVVWARGTTEAEAAGGATRPGPVAHAGGIILPFAKLYLFDHVQDSLLSPPLQIDMVHDSSYYREMLGHLLGHEWAHYAYGVRDEYYRNPDPTQISGNSLMGDQRLAVGAGPALSLQWLNFSTDETIGWENPSFQQVATWNADAWQFLKQDCYSRPEVPFNGALASSVVYADDGTVGGYNTTPTHVYYPQLDAPTAADTWLDTNTGTTLSKLQADLTGPLTPGEPALEHLNIAWSASEVEMELILDISGSMEGQPLANVRDAGQTFVDQVILGRTALGVTTFETAVNTGVQPLISIATETDKSTVKSAIAGIVAGDNTRMFDATVASLDKLDAYRNLNGTNARRVAFLLSDGNDNASSNTEQTVIDRYKAAGVRVHTVGFADRDGSEAFFAPLQNIALRTHGQFHPGITEVAEISEAMRRAFGDALTIQDIELEGQGCLSTADPFAPTMCQLEVEMDFARMVYRTDYAADPGASIGFTVRAPNGAVVPATVSTVPGPNGTLTTELIVDGSDIASFGHGQWSVTGTATGGSVDLIAPRVLATPGDEIPVELTIGSRRQAYRYPEPIQFHAVSVLDANLTGLAVTAELVSPSRTSHQIPLNDDGTGYDAVAGDGVYSGQFADYTENGTYDIKVSALSNGAAARVTYDASTYAPTAVPLGYEFSRRAELSIGVYGIAADDHGNEPDDATVINVNSRQRAGKLETSGDVDFFRLDGVDISQDLSVRLTEADFGLAPLVTVFNSAGEPIASGNVFTASTAGGYISVPVPAAQLEPSVYIAVTDLNDRAGGTYAIDGSPTVLADANAATLLEVRSRDARDGVEDISSVEIQVENVSQQDVSDFKVVYYFETEYFEEPVLEDLWSPESVVTLVERGTEQYAIELDYTGYTLQPGQALPLAPENSFVLHHTDWSAWDTGNDFSNIETLDFTVNRKIAVFNSLGVLVHGAVPPVHPPREPVVDIVVYSRDEKLFDPAWSSPEIYLENRADNLSDFRVIYYFTRENGQTPILDVWEAPEAMVTLESLGGDAYRIEYDYAGYTLPHTYDDPWPTRTLVGLHYPNWSTMDKNNDPSNNRSSVSLPNLAIEVYDGDGTLIYGGGTVTAPVWLEAEAGARSGSPLLSLTSDAGASNGQCLAATTNSPSTPGASRATYTFNAESGTYTLWGRVRAPTLSADSFWVSVDGGAFVRWNEIGAGDTWVWDQVHNSDNGNAAVSYTLSAGTHTLVVANREAGARIDQLYLTPNGDSP